MDLARNIYPDVLQYLSDSEYHQETVCASSHSFMHPNIIRDEHKIFIPNKGYVGMGCV